MPRHAYPQMIHIEPRPLKHTTCMYCIHILRCERLSILRTLKTLSSLFVFFNIVNWDLSSNLFAIKLFLSSWYGATVLRQLTVSQIRLLIFLHMRKRIRSVPSYSWYMNYSVNMWKFELKCMLFLHGGIADYCHFANVCLEMFFTMLSHSTAFYFAALLCRGSFVWCFVGGSEARAAHRLPPRRGHTTRTWKGGGGVGGKGSCGPLAEFEHETPSPQACPLVDDPPDVLWLPCWMAVGFVSHCSVSTKTGTL